MIAWVRRRFSRRLAAALCLTSVVSVVATWMLVGHYFQKSLLSELTESLAITTTLVEAETDKSHFLTRDHAALSARSRFISDASGARISFIAADGTVLGDSSVPAARVREIKNHRDRPEMIAAMAGGRGRDVRVSETTGERFLYTAVPARLGGKTVGVVRAAYPLTAIEEKEARVRHGTAALTALVLLFAVGLALALASSLGRPIREMSQVAARLARGDYESRVIGVIDEEHGRLSETLNHLASQVQAKINELSRDKSRLAAILGNMSEGVVATDAAGRILEINTALSRLFDLDPAAAHGRHFLEVLRHHQLDRLVQGVLADQQPRIDEVRTFSPDERIFEAQAAPIHDDDRFAGVLVVLHDITRLRRLEQVRRDFVANVSHELRTPLASIKGFAETLEMGAIDDPKNARNFVESIGRQADRMTALVEDLLDLAAIESGERRPVIEAVELKDVLEDVAGGLRPLAARRKIALEVRLPAALPAVAADRLQLRQIFVNLLENAVKFTPSGTVTVTATPAGDRLDVQVVDTGIGIPAQDLDRIFERFYRVDRARSREMGGTGLGLSIVRHLVEAHGGQVAVESSEGKGSTFTVSLPIHRPI